MNTQWFLSSVGNGKLALTIRGLLVALVPTLLIIAQLKGWAVTQDQAMHWVDTVVQVVTDIATGIAAVMTVIGFVRRVYLKVKGQGKYALSVQ